MPARTESQPFVAWIIFLGPAHGLKVYLRSAMHQFRYQIGVIEKITLVASRRGAGCRVGKPELSPVCVSLCPDVCRSRLSAAAASNENSRQFFGGTGVALELLWLVPSCALRDDCFQCIGRDASVRPVVVEHAHRLSGIFPLAVKADAATSAAISSAFSNAVRRTTVSLRRRRFHALDQEQAPANCADSLLQSIVIIVRRVELFVVHLRVSELLSQGRSPALPADSLTWFADNGSTTSRVPLPLLNKIASRAGSPIFR